MFKSISSFFRKKAEMQRAVAILKTGMVYLQGYSKTDHGLWIGYGRVICVKAYDFDALSTAVRKVIKASSQHAPHPSNWSIVQQPMLDATGAKNWKNLSRGAIAVGISSEAEILRFTPSKNYEADGGTDLPEKIIHAGVEEMNLGEILMKAFELCEP